MEVQLQSLLFQNSHLTEQPSDVTTLLHLDNYIILFVANTDSALVNSAEHGGGVAAVSFSNTTTTSCTFSGNTASDFGGAMTLYEDTKASVKHSSFRGNHSTC